MQLPPPITTNVIALSHASSNPSLYVSADLDNSIQMICNRGWIGPRERFSVMPAASGGNDIVLKAISGYVQVNDGLLYPSGTDPNDPRCVFTVIPAGTGTNNLYLQSTSNLMIWSARMNDWGWMSCNIALDKAGDYETFHVVGIIP